MPSKLYVGNLAYSVTNADLNSFFHRPARFRAQQLSWTSSRPVEGLRLCRNGERGRGLQGYRPVQ